MNRICSQCGKQFAGEGISFCPYCGVKMNETSVSDVRNREAEKWVSKALSTTSFPERKKILLKGQEAFPDSLEIAWELLFIGEEPPKRLREIDYSIIKSWVMEIYRNPGVFSEEKRDHMRAQLYDAPQLVQTLNRFERPEEKQQEYLYRLCTEYVELFLEGNNQVMGNLFGVHLERNKEKKLAVPVAQMIERIRADEKLLPEQREQLWKAMYQAYSARTGGKTAYLDDELARSI